MDLRHLEVGHIETRLEVELDAEAMRGRLGFKTGIRPNHWLPGREYTFVGKLDFTDREWLRPGEKCTAVGHLIIAEQDLGSFVPGFTWQIGESVYIVGRCTLLSIEGACERLLSSPGG